MKHKKLTLLLLCILSIFTLSAETNEVEKPEKKWEFKGTPGINFAQNSFSNWVTGGADITALNFDTKIYVDYKGDNFTWNNYLNAEYGFNRQKIQGNRKVVDKLDYQTDFSLKGPNNNFRYSATIKLKSQFDEGYDYRAINQWYLTSSWFAPGYISASVGMEYIGTKNLIVSFLPLTEKTTIVSEKYYDKKVINVFYDGYEPEFEPKEDNTTGHPGGHPYAPHPPTEADKELIENRLDSTLVTYGLAWRENVRYETGIKLAATYSIDNIFKDRIGIKSRFEVFSSYTNFLKPDIDWEVWFSFKFHKNIAFNINCELLYDSDMQTLNSVTNELEKAKVQFRNFMGIGLSYTFDNK